MTENQITNENVPQQQQPFSLIKTHFSLETYLVERRATSNSYQYSSVDQLMVMDLDAFNYISAVLFEGMGTEEPEVEALDLADRQQIFKEEFLSNMRLFDTIKRPEVLPIPILKRLNIGVALVAIELLTFLRNKEIPDEESQEGIVENYHKNREMVECYDRLVKMLLSDALETAEKGEQIITDIIVEFKSLAFLSELAGGVYDTASKDIKKFDADQAVVLLEQKLTLTVDETMAMGGERPAELLASALYLRRTELLRGIGAGEVALDSAVSMATESTLIKCLITIAISANTDMLPVLHPLYRAQQTQVMQQRCKDTIQAGRKRKGGPANAKPDWLTTVPAQKKPRATTPRRDVPEHTGPRPSRKRKVWSDEETEALRMGMEQYGNDWVAIHRHYSHILVDRHPVGLKDRARSMRRILERNNQPLGVWASASRP